VPVCIGPRDRPWPDEAPSNSLTHVHLGRLCQPGALCGKNVLRIFFRHVLTRFPFFVLPRIWSSATAASLFPPHPSQIGFPICTRRVGCSPGRPRLLCPSHCAHISVCSSASSTLSNIEARAKADVFAYPLFSPSLSLFLFPLLPPSSSTSVRMTQPSQDSNRSPHRVPAFWHAICHVARCFAVPRWTKFKRTHRNVGVCL